MYVTGQFQNYSISKSRLNIYKLSFVPKATVEWNAIPLEVRRSTALSSDRKITLQSDMHLSLGERYRNIIHTRLRYTELC